MHFRSQLVTLGLLAVATMSPLAGAAAASVNPAPPQDAQPAVMVPPTSDELDAPAAATGPRWVENPALPRQFAIKASTQPSSGAAPVCPGGAYCAYYDTYRDGGGIGWSGDENQWSFLIEDKDESSWNNGTTGRGVTLYRNAGYNGALGCLPRGQYWNIHNPMHTGSSHRWAGC